MHFNNESDIHNDLEPLPSRVIVVAYVVVSLRYKATKTSQFVCCVLGIIVMLEIIPILQTQFSSTTLI